MFDVCIGFRVITGIDGILKFGEIFGGEVLGIGTFNVDIGEILGITGEI